MSLLSLLTKWMHHCLINSSKNLNKLKLLNGSVHSMCNIYVFIFLIFEFYIREVCQNIRGMFLILLCTNWCTVLKYVNIFNFYQNDNWCNSEITFFFRWCYKSHFSAHPLKSPAGILVRNIHFLHSPIYIFSYSISCFSLKRSITSQNRSSV